MKQIIIFALVLSYTLSLQVFAQSSTVIRGRVTEESSGEPLPGVNIVEIDDQNRIVKGVITDINGNYVLEVDNASHSIRVSYLGYKSKTFSIDSRSTINVTLQQKTTELEEVTVTAESQSNTLTGVSSRDQTGSSARVNMEKLSGQAGASAADALQGQVSGLDIVSASGAPGAGSNIVIRGMGSLGNTNPLIVVDGIPQDVNSGNFNFASADQHDLGQLLNITPQDIKSVEVLKDAATTATWGTKGANGVLLIETQKGSKGKITFNYQYKLSSNIQPPNIPMLNGDEYITMQLEQWHNAQGVYDIPPEISLDRNYDNYYNYSANTDWLGEISKNSYTHDHFFKISGGGEKSLYYTSINFQNEDGTTINTGFRRFSVRANFNYTLSDKLRFTTMFNYLNTYREDNPESLVRIRGEGWWNIRQLAYVKAPNMSIWEFDENGNPTGEYFNPIENYQGGNFIYLNPLAVSNLGNNDVAGNEVQNNFVLNYYTFNWMTIKETISFAYSNDKGNRFIPSAAIGVDWLDGWNNYSLERNNISTRLLSRTQMILNPLSGNQQHSLTSVLMWEMSQSKNEQMRMVGNRSGTDKINDPAGNLPIATIFSVLSEERLFGALASLSYKFRDRYLFTFNARSDGSSTFGSDNQWGFFPSVSAGWRFSEESFLQPFEFLGESKLRVSWGQSGKGIENPNDRYVSYSYYETSGQYMEDLSIVPTQLELSKLKWQTVTSWNAGVDLNLFNDRVYITADVYDKITTDLLHRNYDIPTSSSYNRLPWFNGGELRNRGWEFFSRGTVINRNDFQFALNFNISQNINSFISFPENFQTEKDANIGNGRFPRKAEVGKPIGSFYGFRYNGVYARDNDAVATDEDGNTILDAYGNPIPMSYNNQYEFRGGDAIYDDINHDGRIDILDAVYIGDSSPKFIGGFGTTVDYKDISASVNFHYRLGFDIVNEVAMETEGMLDRHNQSKAVLYRWKRQGDDEPQRLPRAYMNHPANNLGSDRYVEAGDFLRLNNISIDYTLSQDLARRFGLTSMEVGLNMRNLLTFTNYSGQDPEIGRVGTDPFYLGTDEARTPPPRVFALRLNVNF